MSEVNNSLGEVDREGIRASFFVKINEMKRVFGSEYTKNFFENIMLENDNKSYSEKHTEKRSNPYEIRVPADSVCLNCLGTLDDFCPLCNR